jgi:hypothetical protein
VPSTERLARTNRIDNFRAKFPQPLTVVPIVKRLRTIDDDEAELLYIAGRIYRRLVLRHSVDEVIQAGPQVCDAVPYHETPSQQSGTRPQLLSDQPVLCELRVVRQGKIVTALLRPTSDLAPEQFEMFFSAA